MLRHHGTLAAWLTMAAMLSALGPFVSSARAQQTFGPAPSPNAQANLADGYWSMYGGASQLGYAAAQYYAGQPAAYGAPVGNRPAASAASGAYGGYDAPRKPSPAELATSHHSHRPATGQSARGGGDYVSYFGSGGSWAEAKPAPQPQYYYYYEAPVVVPAEYPVMMDAAGQIMMSQPVPSRPASFNALAILQDPIEDDEPAAGEPVSPLPNPEAEPNAAAPGGRTNAEGEQTFGEEPPGDSLQFLRQQTVLLEPGDRQIEVGLQYGIAEGFVLLPQIVDGQQVISTIRARQRQMIAPIEVRYGLCEKCQLFYNIPFGWSNTEVSFPGFDSYRNKGGMGDINAGVSILVKEGCGYGPDVVATLSFTAPTGVSDLAVVGILPPAVMGEGYWAGSASLLWIQTYDPVVVFYGLGYRHRFDADFVDGTVTVDPGEQFIYQFGIGFAANESITLSTSFLGLYVTEAYVNDRRVQGGIQEPMRMRFAATIAKPCTIHEPFAEIGMTSDTFSALIGMSITF